LGTQTDWKYKKEKEGREPGNSSRIKEKTLPRAREWALAKFASEPNYCVRLHDDIIAI
jgi:hypothetical protein